MWTPPPPPPPPPPNINTFALVPRCLYLQGFTVCIFYLFYRFLKLFRYLAKKYMYMTSSHSLQFILRHRPYGLLQNSSQNPSTVTLLFWLSAYRGGNTKANFPHSRFWVRMSAIFKILCLLVQPFDSLTTHRTRSRSTDCMTFALPQKSDSRFWNIKKKLHSSVLSQHLALNRMGVVWALHLTVWVSQMKLNLQKKILNSGPLKNSQLLLLRVIYQDEIS